MTDPLTTPPAASLTDLLQLERLDDDVFVSTYGGPADDVTSPAVYGGQLAAQALFAAGLTLDGERRSPHSAHCYFLDPGSFDQPVRFEVARVRDGGSFSSRTVLARQGETLLCTLAAGFVAHRDGGWREQDAQAPEVRPPGASSPFRLGKLLSFEGRDPDGPVPRMERPPRFWTRAAGPFATDPLTQAVGLVYMSDIAAGSPVAGDGSARPRASLNHVVWFHREIDLGEWLLVDLHAVVTRGGRTFFDGRIFDERGELVASVAQEQLFR
jgi:acyl-CoA thioesterase II